MKYSLTKKNIINKSIVNFDIAIFDKLPKMSSKMSYISERLAFIGHGSSRMVFSLGDGKVIKVAGDWDLFKPSNDPWELEASWVIEEKWRTTEMGKAQNKQEVNVYTDPSCNSGITIIYDISDDYSWIISEYVEEINTRAEIEKLSCTTLHIWERILELYSLGTRIDKTTISNFLDQKFNLTDILTAQITQTAFRMIDLGVLYNDLVKIEHWGISKDGCVKLLDYGYNQNVKNEFYDLY